MAQVSILRFEGHQAFRQRLILATLTGKAVRIDHIRSADSFDHPGLCDYEASFLRLLEKLSNGCVVEINHSGTAILYKPGTLIGGTVRHECPTSRAVGYFLEPLVALAPFAKLPFHLTLSGITNDNVDCSVDVIRTVLLPQLCKFGVGDGVELKANKRGAPPNGGGEVVFQCPIVRALKPIQCMDPGRIKRIRGIAYATRVSPQMANRAMESARSLLTQFIPDVYIYTDVYKGADSGKSPGFGLSLVAESTTGALLSAECAYQPRSSNQASETNRDNLLKKAEHPGTAATPEFATPEDLGLFVGRLLLSEIQNGGCMDTSSQWLGILYMALGPEDVSKLRVGSLTPFSMQYLRDIRTFLGVTFKVKSELDESSVVLSCLGVGHVNVNRKAA